MRFELKLVDIQLKNFRLFDEIKVNFDDKLTVLIGENGAGKTSILDAIRKALNPIILRLRTNTTALDDNTYYDFTDVKFKRDAILTDIVLQQIFEENDSELMGLRQKELTEIEEAYQKRLEELNNYVRSTPEHSDDRSFWLTEIELLERETQEQIADLEERLGKQIELQAEEIRYRLNPTFKPDVQKQPFEAENIHKIGEVAQKIDEARKQNRDMSLPILAYYPCERINTNNVNGQEQNNQMGMFNAYDHALDGLSLDYKDFLDWYDWQDRIERRTKSNRILGIVKQAILDMLNDPDDAPFKSIDIDPSQFKNPRLVLLKEEAEVEVNQLSSGEKSLLMMVSNLAYRLALLNPNSENPLKEGQGIVLIDEIDLHLHPSWQRKVIGKLQELFPKIQWVITTHSPLVLTYAPNGKVLRLINQSVEEYRHFRGMRLTDIFYDLYETTSRPKAIQTEIDKLFEQIDNENWEQARQSLDDLKKTLPTNDPAIIEAETSLNLVL
jgi:predicted ATP-binding protein involved in virulence